MKKEKKDKIFEKYQGYVIKIVANLWDTWEYKNNASFNYLSKEDVIQEAYIKLLEIIDKLDLEKTESQIVLFISQSIKNHILNIFRNSVRLKSMGNIEHNDVDTIESGSIYKETIQKTVVLEFMERLNKNEQYFVSLLLNGLSDEEIINKIKWTEKTFKEKKQYFHEILEDMIDGYL